MSRVGVSSLLHWQNARVNNPNKLNLIKSAFRYNQTTWYCKIGFKNKSPNSVKFNPFGLPHQTLNYMWISSWGIMIHSCRLYGLINHEPIYKFKLPCGECDIGKNYVDYKYPDKFHVSFLVEDYYTTAHIKKLAIRYETSQFCNIHGDLARCLADIKMFMHLRESEFRELKHTYLSDGTSV